MNNDVYACKSPNGAILSFTYVSVTLLPWAGATNQPMDKGKFNLWGIKAPISSCQLNDSKC